MIIRQKRVRTLDRALSQIVPGDYVIFGISEPRRMPDPVRKVGFRNSLNGGDTVLPAALGPVSTFNARGKHIVHKDKPMETAYRQIEWHWTEFHGPDRVEKSDIRDVPYERYPRTFVPPPSVELSVALDTKGNILIAAPRLRYTKENTKKLLHTINLLLELFGECEVFTGNLDRIIKAEVRRLNWQVLPAGKHPWAELRKKLDPIINEQPEGNQTVIRYRFEKINKHKPSFVAVGEAGFRGYVIFGFPDKNLFVLESTHEGNATYVFAEDWEKLSRMTKAEILNESLYKDRLIHRVGWDSRVVRLLSA